MRYCVAYGGYGDGDPYLSVEVLNDKFYKTHEEAFNAMIYAINADLCIYNENLQNIATGIGHFEDDGYCVEINNREGSIDVDGCFEYLYKIFEIPDPAPTLKEYLDTHKSLECELFGAFECDATFVWEDLELTEEGYQQFKPIMDCEIKVYENGNIEVLVGEDPEDKLSKMVNHFVLSTAGYCSVSNYDEWFK